MHDAVVVTEFSHQARAFDRAVVMSSAETLGALLELVPERARGCWLEAACGTGVVARALAAKVDEVVSIDSTAAMLESGGARLGRRDATTCALSRRAQPKRRVRWASWW